MFIFFVVWQREHTIFEIMHFSNDFDSNSEVIFFSRHLSYSVQVVSKGPVGRAFRFSFLLRVPNLSNTVCCCMLVYFIYFSELYCACFEWYIHIFYCNDESGVHLTQHAASVGHFWGGCLDFSKYAPGLLWLGSFCDFICLSILGKSLDYYF